MGQSLLIKIRTVTEPLSALKISTDFPSKSSAVCRGVAQLDTSKKTVNSQTGRTRRIVNRQVYLINAKDRGLMPHSRILSSAQGSLGKIDSNATPPLVFGRQLLP